MSVFAPRGQRIPAQGKLVLERRPGCGWSKNELPCKGNGLKETRFIEDDPTSGETRLSAPGY